MELSGVKKLLDQVRLEAVSSRVFRVHPEERVRDTLATLEWREDGEFYILTPGMVAELRGSASTSRCIRPSTAGRDPLFRVKPPGSDGRVLEAHRSLDEAVERAMTRWTRIAGNRSLGAYDIEASLQIPDPEWPKDVTFKI